MALRDALSLNQAAAPTPIAMARMRLGNINSSNNIGYTH